VKRLERIPTRVETALAVLERSTWLPTLLVRLFVGYFFFETGLGKVQNLGTMAERFAEWGIPAPAFSAALSGYTELIGGGLIVLGLFTRLASIPMVINMVVAILVVKMKKVSGVNDFVELDEPLYALTFLWLVFAGPGNVSLDHFLYPLWKRKPSMVERQQHRPCPDPSARVPRDG
jgi:putative oxidoreductase